MSTASHRTMRFTWRRAMPTARNRPNSRIRSVMESTRVFTMPRRAMRMANASSTTSRLSTESIWASMSAMSSSVLVTSTFGKASVTASTAARASGTDTASAAVMSTKRSSLKSMCRSKRSSVMSAGVPRALFSKTPSTVKDTCSPDGTWKV